MSFMIKLKVIYYSEPMSDADIAKTSAMLCSNSNFSVFPGMSNITRNSESS